MKKESVWVKTPIANLYRYKPSGAHFMRAKIKGHDIKRSLKTKSFEIAKLNLAVEHKKEVERIEKVLALGVGSGTVGGLISAYKAKDEASHDIRDSTKKYHKECVGILNRSWPELVAIKASKLTLGECEAWAHKLRGKYSPTRYNGTVDVFRAILEQAIETGLRHDNPAKKLGKASVKQKELRLPSHLEFIQILEHLDTFNKGKRKQAAVVVRFLAFTGMRINEAAQITKEMIDWERNQISLPGKITKNGKPRHVPILLDLKPLLVKQLQDHAKKNDPVPLLPCRDPSRSLEACCKLVGVPKLTNHDLRHLFITRCIESGVDVKTIAEWVGHQDGGALILKTYAHLRNEHSQAMAAKVSFAQPLPAGVIKLEQAGSENAIKSA